MNYIETEIIEDGYNYLALIHEDGSEVKSLICEENIQQENIETFISSKELDTAYREGVNAYV